MNSVSRNSLDANVSSEHIFRICFPEKLSREQSYFAALLRRAYESGKFNDETIVWMTDLIKEMPTSPDAKQQFLQRLWFSEKEAVVKTTEAVDGVREHTQWAVEASMWGTSEKKWEWEALVTDATISIIHLNVSSIQKQDGKEISREERKFLIQLSEWNLLGLLGDGALKRIQEKITYYSGVSPQENIDTIKREFWINAKNFYKGVYKKSEKPCFHNFSMKSIDLLSPEVKDFLFRISRVNRFSLRNGFNPEIITKEQDEVLRKSRSSRTNRFLKKPRR